MKEALFCEKKENGITICRLCPHNCRIAKGKRGFCFARRNVDGRLIAESYGQITSIALDPVEKKPLYRFYPGRMILSVGSYGCNMKCCYCQNHTISQQVLDADFVSPQNLVVMAKNVLRNIGVAFTYNEPLISLEYILDTAPLLKKQGLKTVLVTNGMINPEPLKQLLPYLDAVNIDLKTFDAAKYKKLGGNLATVMQTIEICAAAKIHVEITSLIVPGQNDSISDMRAQCQWLAKISPDIPLHITRFSPRYKMMDSSPTPAKNIKDLASIARQYLKNVY